jgi:hypothetical protein
MQSSSRPKVPRLSAEDHFHSREDAGILAVESFEWSWMQGMQAVKTEVE